MIDLLYDKAALPLIQERFPHVEVEDASDFIHEDRVQIELPDADKDALYKHAIKEGYHTVLLGFQLMRTGAKQSDIEQIKAWIEEIKAETVA